MSVPPERRAEIVGALRRLAGPIRAHDGCAGWRILQDLDDEDALVVVQEWTSTEAFVRHLRSEEYRLLLAIVERSLEPPQIHFDRVAERRGVDLVVAVRAGRDLRPVDAPDPPEAPTARSDGFEAACGLEFPSEAHAGAAVRQGTGPGRPPGPNPAD